jgi:hypothetical protein
LDCLLSLDCLGVGGSRMRGGSKRFSFISLL